MNIIYDNYHIIKYDTNYHCKALELMDLVFPIVCELQVLIRGNYNNISDNDGLPDYLRNKIYKIIKFEKMSNIPKNYLKTLVDTKYFEEEKMSDYIEAYWDFVN